MDRPRKIQQWNIISLKRENFPFAKFDKLGECYSKWNELDNVKKNTAWSHYYGESKKNWIHGSRKEQ